MWYAAVFPLPQNRVPFIDPHQFRMKAFITDFSDQFLPLDDGDRQRRAANSSTAEQTHSFTKSTTHCKCKLGLW